PHSWRPEQPGPSPGNVGSRVRSRRGAPGGPATPDSTDASSPQTGADGLPFRVRPPRPESSGIGARNRVILSNHDLTVIARAGAGQEGTNAGRAAAAGQSGPCLGPLAEAPQRPASPPAMTQALPAANPTPPWSTVLANTILLWAARRRFWPAARRWRVTSALILAAVLFCGGAGTDVLARGTIAGREAANGGQSPGGAALAAAGPAA